jgi:hypothetical protein
MKGSKLLDLFRRQEADSAALAAQLNRWSRTMIGVLIQEQEQKLLASDLPVEPEEEESFWGEVA